MKLQKLRGAIVGGAMVAAALVVGLRLGDQSPRRRRHRRHRRRRRRAAAAAAARAAAAAAIRSTCADAATQKSYVGCDYWPTVTPNAVSSDFDFAVVVANTGTTDAIGDDHRPERLHADGDGDRRPAHQDLPAVGGGAQGRRQQLRRADRRSDRSVLVARRRLSPRVERAGHRLPVQRARVQARRRTAGQGLELVHADGGGVRATASPVLLVLERRVAAAAVDGDDRQLPRHRLAQRLRPRAQFDDDHRACRTPRRSRSRCRRRARCSSGTGVARDRRRRRPARTRSTRATCCS